MYNLEFEGFGIVLVCHVACDDAQEEVFVDASGVCVAALLSRFQ